MQFDFIHKPCNTAVKVILQAGETCTAEAGSMIAMDSHLDVETSTYKRGKRGLLKSLKRMFAGESFFLNHYTANAESELWLSTPHPGDMTKVDFQGDKLIVQSGSFVACDEGIDIDTGWQGFKALLSGESFFWLSLSGSGQAILNSFGAIYEVDVDGEYIVDTGHIVAFDEGLSFSLSKAGSSWIQSWLGGEGIICKFKGKGKLYCQSHNLTAFGRSLTPHLAPKVRN